MQDGNGRQELRCFCSRSPLLAVYGRDKGGQLFVHVKIYKQHRVYGETVHRGGEVEIRCRECIRWHRIVIKGGKPVLLAVDEPPEISAGEPQNADLPNAGVLFRPPV